MLLLTEIMMIMIETTVAQWLNICFASRRPQLQLLVLPGRAENILVQHSGKPLPISVNNREPLELSTASYAPYLLLKVTCFYKLLYK